MPGQSPKPPPEPYRIELWRCLVEGVRRADARLGAELRSRPDCFRLIAWNFLYYGRHANLDCDRRWIDRLLATHGPSELDIQEARSWRTRAAWLIYSLGDLMPFLVHFLPDPEIRATLEASRRYFENDDGVGAGVRSLLRLALDEAARERSRVLLIGHSLGSVIAYDTLWERSRRNPDDWRVDLFLTLGSPLGVRFIQRRLRGARAQGRERYPDNVRRWLNIAAAGELRALDRTLRGDYAQMIELELVEDIRDETEGVYNYFRNDDGLNVHRDFGYLVNAATGRAIADWLREAE